MHRLKGKTALVTGGTTGIGLATAIRFAEEGARVFIMGRREAELQRALGRIGTSARGVRGDVARLEDLDALYAQISEEADGLDVVFANAGGGSFLPLAEMTEDHYRQVFDTNVKGTLFTVQKALPLLRPGASIILTGSTTGVKGTPAFGVYSASKAAIRNFARTWILELSPDIRVNIVSPGSTSTPGWHGLAPSAAENEEMQRLTRLATPLGRLGTPEEIASAVLFLASDESSYVTGSELFVDGGAAQI